MTSGRDDIPADPQYPSQEPDETLIDRGLDDPLDEGFVAPEKWSAGEGFGTTAEEQREGESFEQRLAQEIPEPDPYQEAEVEQENLDDGEVGRERSGRLAEPNGGIGEDTESELLGEDVGIDAGAASAEEAAVHTIEDDE